MNTKYIPQKKIGGGTFSEVFLCLSKPDHELVAIKKLKKTKSKLKPEFLGLLNSEINILTSIKNDNIVKLMETFLENDYYHLVFEYCSSGDLEKYLQNTPRKCIPEPEVLGFLKQLLNGFRGIHDLKVMHRDFKLDNILIKDGVLKIADFGFCKQGDLAETYAGTAYYMAPEIMDSENYTNKVDIWSLGVCLYRMVFGIFPFRPKKACKFALREEIREGKIEFCFENKKISCEMEDLIRKMLVEDPKKRIDWNMIYEHPLLNQENGNREMFGGLASQVLNRKIIEREKVNFQFEANKKEYSVVEKTFDNKEAEKNEEVYSKKQNEFFCEKGEKNEKVGQNKKNNENEENENILEEKRKKDAALLFFERKFLYKRNFISIYAKILNDGLKFNENHDATFMYFLILKKICALSEKFSHVLTEKNHKFGDPQFFKIFVESDFYNSLTEIFLSNFETYRNYFTIYLNECFSKSDYDFYYSLLVELNDDFHNIKAIDNLLLESICNYISFYRKKKSLTKEEIVFLNKVADCVKFKEIFKFSQENEEGFDFQGYEQFYQEKSKETVMEKLEEKFKNLCEKQD